MARFKWLSWKRETTKPTVVEKFSRRERETYKRVRAAISDSRATGISLSKAARRNGTTLQTIRAYADSAIDRKRGRLIPKKSDRLVAQMTVVTPNGIEVVSVKGLGKRRLVKDHLFTSIQYAEGKVGPEAFRKFSDKTVAGKKLDTNPDRILRTIVANRPDYDDLYADKAA